MKDSHTTRNILPKVVDVPFSFSDTISSLIDKCLIYFGLLKQSDLTSTSSSNGGRASSVVAVLFDYEHI
jgi:hypothetical protein